MLKRHDKRTNEVLKQAQFTQTLKFFSCHSIIPPDPILIPLKVSEIADAVRDLQLGRLDFEIVCLGVF
jgi:hypothetical protein